LFEFEMNMKEKNNFEVRQCGSAAHACVASKSAGATLDRTLATADPDSDMIYRCKNCGRSLTPYEIINFYGLPACPVCFNAAAPFELELLAPDTQVAAMHS
jgi:hypothetical protein